MIKTTFTAQIFNAGSESARRLVDRASAIYGELYGFEMSLCIPSDNTKLFAYLDENGHFAGSILVDYFALSDSNHSFAILRNPIVDVWAIDYDLHVSLISLVAQHCSKNDVKVLGAYSVGIEEDNFWLKMGLAVFPFDEVMAGL